MTESEILAWLRENSERVYRNKNGFWLRPLRSTGEVSYDAYKSAGPFTTLDDAVLAANI
jgi:hypothetical protein